MVDAEVVRRRLRQIDLRVAALRTIGDGDADTYLEDLDLQALTERHLQVAIQAAIDIAFHILASDAGETPEDYGSAFALLSRSGVIPLTLAERLRLATGLRNLLVHAYAEVDARLVWGHLRDVEDLTAFAGHVESYLERHVDPAHE